MAAGLRRRKGDRKDAGYPIRARFTKAAKWSGISGGVLIQWNITKQGGSQDIRVLNDVHPLLAGLAIEAAASTTVKAKDADRLPLTKRVMFRFGKP